MPGYPDYFKTLFKFGSIKKCLLFTTKNSSCNCIQSLEERKKKVWKNLISGKSVITAGNNNCLLACTVPP